VRLSRTPTCVHIKYKISTFRTDHCFLMTLLVETIKS
jgi:hypothetical protein